MKTIVKSISNQSLICISIVFSEEYLSLFHSKGGLKSMRQNALKSGLRSCRFRSLCWRVSHS